ncbi:MAG: spermidine/putrescine ABC transporter substrate-binding protein [Paenibacillaceae bacterium]
MKKSLLLWVMLTLVFGTILAGCSSKKQQTSDGLDTELNLFNWSEYLPQSVLDKFKEKYGVKVNYTTYSSNEEMLAKLSAGAAGFDLAVSTDYMVDIMKKQNLLQEIDMSSIPNIKNIGDEFKNLSFDPGNKYTVPYMWGDAVIAVNSDKVKEPIKGYKDLWNPAFKNSIVVLDDQRAIIGAALKKNGHSMNEKDEKILEQAKQDLKQLAPNIKAYDSDSPKTLLINGEASIGLVWGAEASLAMKENPKILVVLPEEGMYIWQDNFVIPKGAPHKKTAEVFINFILDPEISAEISKAFPYANPNVEAKKLMDKSVLEDVAVYPPNEEVAKGEHLQDLGDVTKIYDRIWSEVKQ